MRDENRFPILENVIFPRQLMGLHKLLNFELVEQVGEAVVRVAGIRTSLKVLVRRLVCMRVHYYVLILYREGTNVRTYVKFLAPAA